MLFSLIKNSHIQIHSAQNIFIFVLLNIMANYAFDESPKPPVATPTTATTPAEVPPLPTQEGGAGEEDKPGP